VVKPQIARIFADYKNNCGKIGSGVLLPPVFFTQGGCGWVRSIDRKKAPTGEAAGADVG